MTSVASSPTCQSTNEFNSLALLACANIFDRLLRQQTAPQVREVLALSGPLAGQEDAALQSAWSLFMQQASSTLGTLGGGWGTATASGRSSQPPSPQGSCSPGAERSLATPHSPQPGRKELGENGMPRNGSLVFDFED